MDNAKLMDEFVNVIQYHDGEIIKYSGRGMFGKYCVGVVTNNASKLLIEVAFKLGGNILEATQSRAVDAAASCDEIEIYNELMYKLSKNVCTDSMGLDMVVYFPSWTWEEEFNQFITK